SAPYTFKFYVDHGGARTLVHVVPREVARKARARAASLGQPTKKSFGLHNLDVKPLDGPVTSGQGDQPIIVTGPEDLIKAAATECGMVNDPTGSISDPTNPNNLLGDPDFQDIVAQEQNHQRITQMAPADLWSLFNGGAGGGTPLSYSIFPTAPASCDEVLEDEETLICVADKLAQLADTLSPLRWHAVRFLDNSNTPNDTLAWIVPPPADAEKFIVRDLALEVLAQIPLFDSDPFLTSGLGRTCSAAYADLDTPDATPARPYPL